MITYISMLRGINVSGQKKIRMTELKAMYESLQFKHVETYVQSGNVIFGSTERNTGNLSEQIEAKIEEFLGYSVKVFIRTVDDFKRIITNNPFAQISSDPSQLHVTFLMTTPTPDQLRKLVIPKAESEQYLISRDVVYLHCPDGYGRSKLSNNVIERKLKMSATTRNFRTVNALYEIARERDR